MSIVLAIVWAAMEEERDRALKEQHLGAYTCTYAVAYNCGGEICRAARVV